MTIQEQAQISPFAVGAAFVTWILLVAGLFWYFQFQYQSVWVTFSGGYLPTIEAEPGVTRVVHFVDSECPCTKFSKPHIADVELQWASSEIQFRTVELATTTEFAGLIPAAPAVAAWDEAGELVYFGPYTSGTFCGEGEDLLGRLFMQRLAGQWTNQEAVGCFCEQPAQR
ncbi:MAG: DUF6436 domain-containing protein [Pseudomonadales bacterium]|jgi:hypothetical protein